MIIKHVTSSRIASSFVGPRRNPHRLLASQFALSLSVVAAVFFSAVPAWAIVGATTLDTGTSPPGALQTELTGDGWCQVTTTSEGLGRAACRDRLLPRRPIIALETPGAFFVGYAFGKNSQLVYGPQVGVAGAILFPIRRPFLELGPSVDGKLQFRLPTSMSFTFDLAASISVNLASFTFPNSASQPQTDIEVDLGSGGATEPTFNAGLYLAPQIGAAWWEDGKGRRVALALGLVLGYINTQATGPAFVLGGQPAIVAQF